MATPLAHPWVCVFLSRTGGHAQALFITKERARRFAERHARTFTSSGTPLMWVDTVTSSVLSTDIGEYLVTRIGQEECRSSLTRQRCPPASRTALDTQLRLSPQPSVLLTSSRRSGR
jgi:hypothetical protein